MRQKISFLKKLIKSPIFSVALVFVLVFGGIALTKEIIKRSQVQKEINKLEQEVKLLENENLKLADLLEYLNTDFFKEKEARLKLGLQKPGEKLIIISPSTGEEIPVEIEAPTPEEPKPSNPIRWLKRLFK